MMLNTTTKQRDKQQQARAIAGFSRRLAAITLCLLACSWQAATARAESGGTTVDSGPLVKIFFTDGNPDDSGDDPLTIKSVNPDGTGLTTLVADAGYYPRGIVLDDLNGQLFWNDSGNPDPDDPNASPALTRRANVAGTGVVELVNHGDMGVYDIDLDIINTRVHAATNPVIFEFGFPIGGVQRFLFDGTDLQSFAAGNSEPVDLWNLH